MGKPIPRFVSDCPRCGGGHYLELRQLRRPAGPYSLWASCETTGEPVFALEKPMTLWDFIREHVSRWKSRHGEEVGHG